MSNIKLSKKLSIFPLSNVIFFPKTTLPLNIFEERYLEMINDSVKNSKLIGMVQPKKNKNSKLLNFSEPELYSIGCVGKIISCEKPQDKRFIISLLGICRFRIEKEIKNEKLYREFLVSYEGFKKDIESENHKNEKLNVKNLLNRIKIFCKKKGFFFNWEELDKLNIQELVNIVSMILPFTVEEKQSLLEANDLNKKHKILNEIVNLYILDDFENKTLQ